MTRKSSQQQSTNGSAYYSHGKRSVKMIKVKRAIPTPLSIDSTIHNLNLEMERNRYQSSPKQEPISGQ